MDAKRQDQAGPLRLDLVRQKGLTLLDKMGLPSAWKASCYPGIASSQAHVKIGKKAGLSGQANLVEKPKEIAPGRAFEVFALGE
jgi:hypothetical protein